MYRHEINELTGTVPALLARLAPGDALRAWLDEVVAYARVKRGVIAVLEASVWHELYEQHHTRIEDALQRMLNGAQADGSVRDDVDATDILLSLGPLSSTAPSGTNAHRASSRSFLNGLSTKEGAPVCKC